MVIVKSGLDSLLSRSELIFLWFHLNFSPALNVKDEDIPDVCVIKRKIHCNVCIGKEEERDSDYPIFCALYWGAQICELGDADVDTRQKMLKRIEMLFTGSEIATFRRFADRWMRWPSISNVTSLDVIGCLWMFLDVFCWCLWIYLYVFWWMRSLSISNS